MKKSVLIVDDNKDFVIGLSKMLTSFCKDYVKSINTCYTGESCLKITNKKSFDVIFLDYEMPGINGPEIASVISDKNRDTKIIGLSFHSGVEFIENMIKAGARSYIIKDQLSLNEIIECFKI